MGLYIEKECPKFVGNKKNVYLCTRKNQNAPVAQLVEHLTLNQGVQGSSPCVCTEKGSNIGVADMAQLVEQRIRNA